MLGVYIHIPFCERKCNYCAFSSFVVDGTRQEEYVESLIDEIKTFGRTNNDEKHRKVDTIFIGGGTPSLLEPYLLKKIVETLRSVFNFEKNLEFTIECNPNSLTDEKLELYKQLGVNRISIGIQSLDEAQLKFIGRLHDAKSAIEATRKSLAKFDNVSADILIGIGGMNEENYLIGLEKLVNLGIKHVSTYMLQVEEGTPLARTVEENREILPSDEECIEVYNKTVKFLKNNGFNQYEVSNFAKKCCECKHNQKYWNGDEYVGFGLSAHSYINGERIANAKTFEEYYNREHEMKEVLTRGQLIEEHIMLGLRCSKGISIGYLSSLGYNIEENEYIAEFLKKGVVYRSEDGDRLHLNKDYYGVNNYIIVHLLPE